MTRNEFLTELSAYFEITKDVLAFAESIDESQLEDILDEFKRAAHSRAAFWRKPKELTGFTA